MNNDPRLEFLENQAGEVEGLGHAGIETFRDTPFTSCAREAGQNSLDAAEGRPVRMVFRTHGIPAHQIPGFEKLKETINQCHKAANDSGSEKDVDFFRNAMRVTSQSIIDVLEISDFNTSGLSGPPNDPKSVFHSLVKSSGKSNKSTETSGGSFGIGKNASFAVSDLRTVFYSTIYEDLGEQRGAVQGKVQLVSHKDAGGEDRTAKGYWGHPEHFSAVEDPALVPEWLRREEKGTSVYSVGFRTEEDWVDRMTVPLVSNFFCAVDDGDIVFSVGDDEHLINKDTLAALLEDEQIDKAAEEASHADDIVIARQLYHCRNSADSVERTMEIRDLGSFRAKILVEEGLPKRVAIVRNGMLIAQSLEHFGDKFSRFPGAKDFVMLVEPADNRASKTLKALENPQHNAFSSGRLDDPEKQKAVQKAMKLLIREIRKLIRENAEIIGGDSVRLDELGEFFADAGPEESKIPSDEKDPETITFTPVKKVRPRAIRPVAPGLEGEEGGAGANEGKGSVGTDGHGNDEGSGSGGSGIRSQQPTVALKNIRNVERAGGGRKVFFTPDESGPLELTFLATGVYDTSDLTVTNATGPEGSRTRNGRLVIDAASGERVAIDVTFSQDYEGPIEVYAVRGAA